MMRYPIGIQSFEKLRTNGYVYVDKTALVYQMTRDMSCYFLSRPRRFGKSLLVSTMEAYFLGRTGHRKAGNGVEDVSCASFGFEYRQV